MLTRFDDYPIHQTPEPVAHTAAADRNFYDRYFFNGFTRSGDLFFAAAMGLYPNRRVLDASLSVVRGGRQHSLHASRLAPGERGENRVGPIAVEVLEPMRRLRLRAEPNEHGLSCDLVFHAATEAIEEERATRRHEGRVFMDSTRFTQFGDWEGRLSVAGEEIDVAGSIGCRDRSWGIRPVGEPEGGAPGAPPQVFWLWAPIRFDGVCTHFGTFEDGEGRPWHAGGAICQTLAEGGEIERLRTLGHRVEWEPGTRRCRSAELDLVRHGGETVTVRLEPILTFQMLGLGYLNPEWGHGQWKGPEAVAGESWALKDLNPLDPRHIHVQQLVRARWGARQGIGVFEQLVLGPHAPSGFRSLFDGAR